MLGCLWVHSLPYSSFFLTFLITVSCFEEVVKPFSSADDRYRASVALPHCVKICRLDIFIVMSIDWSGRSLFLLVLAAFFEFLKVSDYVPDIQYLFSYSPEQLHMELRLFFCCLDVSDASVDLVVVFACFLCLCPACLVIDSFLILIGHCGRLLGVLGPVEHWF